MEIKAGKNKFYIGESENNAFAEIEFDYRDEKVIVAHYTFVQKEFRGQGLAKQLVDALVSFARKNQLKIIPQCSYVRAVFERDKGLDDVKF